MPESPAANRALVFRQQDARHLQGLMKVPQGEPEAGLAAGARAAPVAGLGRGADGLPFFFSASARTSSCFDASSKLVMNGR